MTTVFHTPEAEVLKYLPGNRQGMGEDLTPKISYSTYLSHAIHLRENTTEP